MGHTFISYAREDRPDVVSLASALEAEGVALWLDDRLVAGSHFDTAIEEALAEAASVIVVWSPASVQSRWVRAEAGEGLERGILVPVLLKPTQIPLEFKRVHTVDLTSWQGDPSDHMFVQLLAALKPEAIASRQATPIRGARTHKISANEVTAEVVHVNEAKKHIKILVRLGLDSGIIEHKTTEVGQEVTANGQTIYDGWSFKEHHKFNLQVGDSQHVAELTIFRGRAGTMKSFSLRIDGKEILRERFSWHGTLASYAILVIASLLVAIPAIEVFLAVFEPKKYLSEESGAIIVGLIFTFVTLLVVVGFRLIKRRSRRHEISPSAPHHS